MKLSRHIRLLPVLVAVSALSFGVRFGEIVSGHSSGGSALAQQQAHAPSESELAAPSGEMAQAPAGVTPVKSDESMAGTTNSMATEAASDTAGENETSKEADAWKDAGDSDIEFSDSRMELFEDLAVRRRDLEAREKDIAMREALLKAAEQELDQKFKELNNLKSEIEDLLKEQSEAEQKRIASLVKIYEGMKAKDAARIFDTLDMDVLMQVLSRMSERKSAPIIAAMNPDRARNVTIMLAEQKRLPGLNENTAPLR